MVCDPDFQYSHAVDEMFPKNAVAGATLNTHAGMVSMSTLTKAWNEAYEKWVINNEWKVKEVEAYFKVLTINDATTSRFIDQGR